MSPSPAAAREKASEQRRHDRYPVTLPATITAGKTTTTTMATDVSFGGIFVRTDKPPALRNLVRINLVLPSDSQPIQLLGMAVYVVRPEDARGRVAGAGVQFFGIDNATRERWERFVSGVRAARAVVSRAASAARPHLPEKSAKPELRLNAPSVDALRAAVLGAPEGVITIPAPLMLPPNTSLRLTLVHPESGRHLDLQTVVVAADGKRLRVRLLEREARRVDIERFLDDDFHITVDLSIDEDVDLTGLDA